MIWEQIHGSKRGKSDFHAVGSWHCNGLSMSQILFVVAFEVSKGDGWGGGHNV